VQHQGRGDHGRLRDLLELRVFEVRVSSVPPISSIQLGRAHGKYRLSLAILLGAFLTAQAGSPGQGVDSRRGWFTAPVTVAADGRAEIGTIEGVSGRLADAVRSRLVTRRFVPAQKDGVPVSSTSQLQGTVLLTPAQGDAYAVGLEHVMLLQGPLALKLDPPSFPPQMYKERVSASVELALRVGSDGRVEEVRTINASHPEFDAAVRKAVRRWRFKPSPASPAGGAWVTVPVWFHTGFGRQAPFPPQFKCEPDLSYARIEGQNGCMDMIVVTASRVRTSSTIPIP
jgi:TonB family protein